MKCESLLLSLLFILSISPSTIAQLSPVQAPGPTGQLGPINVVKILTKAAHFKSFVRLLKTTQLDSNLNNQLGDSNNGITIFAPNDAAFAKLKPGTVGSLTGQEKLQLAQLHIVPVFISRSDFDSVGSSPVQTHAGSGDLLQLNVTGSGGSVGLALATGVTNTTLSDTVYMDTHLAIYQVDKVLLPMSIFGAPDRAAQSPGPAAAEGEGSKSGDVDDDESGGGDGGDGDDDGDGVSGRHVSGAVGVVVVNSNIGIAVVVGFISVLALLNLDLTIM